MMKKWMNLCAAFALLLGLCGCAADTPVTGTAFVMDTILEYKLYGSGADAAADAIEQTLADLESALSLYLPDSEISRLNAAAGKKPVKLSNDAFTLLQKCVEYSEMSEGAFDITVAPLALLWNVTAEQPREPPQSEIDALLPLVDYADVLLDPAAQTAMLRQEGQMIDLGGVAKGYACDLARKAAEENGVKKGYISIGGNLMVMGKKSMNEQFQFGVRDPRGGGNDFMATISLPGQTMATSGDYERYFTLNGTRYHHIIDPATGSPARGGLMSVSVVSPDGAYADYMSTALFIRGREYALENINALNCGLILIDEQRNVYVSDSLKRNFAMSDPTGSYRYEVTE